MKGDFTRSTFDRRRRYRSVRMQQGRVQLDADWNEQQDLTLYRIETEAVDTLGGCGFPIAHAGFHVVADVADLTAEEQALPENASPPPLPPGGFYVSGGRGYVSGALCENDRIVPYSQQPDLPLDAPFLGDVSPPPVTLPAEAGTYLAYLDVWERHLTALEAPHIREVALGGPDTATRAQAVWQVRLHRLTAAEAAVADCLGAIPSWDAATAPGTGRLAAQAEEAEASDDPCIVAPGAGYRRLENQLYRVEVHTGGPRSAAVFKWSRDNGSVTARLEAQNAAQDEWTVSSLGRDAVLRFAPGQWVELTDDAHELLGHPGTLARITRAEGTTIRIDPATATGPIDAALFPTNPRVRRWDGLLEAVTNQNPRELEDGVQVRLFGGTYRTGDYWTIPARTATGDVEWPLDPATNEPERQLPHGVRHRYCRLALLVSDGAGWTSITDCRPLFPPVTALTSLFYVSGDGQEGDPGAELPYPLQVGVANGSFPVAGARVRFTVEAGGGEVEGQAAVEVATGADGTVGVRWALGTDEDQRVEAVLLDAAGQPVHLPIRFVARFRAAGEEPGIHVTDLRFNTGDALRNDATFPVALLARGITATCDADVEQAVVRAPGSNTSKPVCFVTLYLPFPLSPSDMELWGQPVVGTRPLRLEAQLAVDDNEVFWNPTEAVRTWLNQRLFPMLAELRRGDRVLAYLTLKGDFIWEAGRERDTPRYLDGEVFGRLRDDGGTDAVLPSGDRRRGGDLEVWFWLVRGEVGTPNIRFEPERLAFGAVAVGASANRTLTVSNTGDGPLTVSASVGPAAFSIVSASSFTVEPGGSAALTVRFAPAAAGAASGQLTLASNDPDTPSAVVPLSGRALPGPTGGRAFVQFIHNASDTGPITVAFDGEVRLEDFPFRSATPFEEVEAGDFEVTILNANRQPLLRETFALEAGVAYVLITCLERFGEGRFSLVVAERARREAETEGAVDVFVASGLLANQEQPSEVDVRVLAPTIPDPVLAERLRTCDRSEYRSLPPASYRFGVGVAGQTATFSLNLSQRAGEAGVLLVSGRLNAQEPQQRLALIGFNARGERL